MEKSTGLSAEEMDDLIRSTRKVKEASSAIDQVQPMDEGSDVIEMEQAECGKLTYKEKLVCNNTPSFLQHLSPLLDPSMLISEEENSFNLDDFIPLSPKRKFDYTNLES